MLYLCDSCKKWTFGLTKDPSDKDSFISDTVEACPDQSMWEGLKVRGYSNYNLFKQELVSRKTLLKLPVSMMKRDQNPRCVSWKSPRDNAKK